MALPPQLAKAIKMKQGIKAPKGTSDGFPYSASDVAEDKKAGVRPSKKEDKAELQRAAQRRMAKKK